VRGTISPEISSTSMRSPASPNQLGADS
jgi:hypothetical protein